MATETVIDVSNIPGWSFAQGTPNQLYLHNGVVYRVQIQQPGNQFIGVDQSAYTAQAQAVYEQIGQWPSVVGDTEGSANLEDPSGGQATFGNIGSDTGNNAFGAYTAGDTAPRTMADFIRDIESQTRASRGYVYDRAADTSAFSRFMNPLARSVIQRQADPLSAQYLLAAAPTQLGGAPSQVGSFQDFISGGTPLAYGAGAYGTRTPEQISAGPFGTYRSPFTRGQWESRLSQLNLPASGDLSTLGADAQDFLAALSQDEARNMISQASLAGLNPITQRSLQPGLNRAFAAWEQANPTAGAGQILSDYVRGGMQRRPFAGYV